MPRNLLALLVAVTLLASGCSAAKPTPVPPPAPVAEGPAPAPEPAPAPSPPPAPPDPVAGLRGIVHADNVQPDEILALLRDFANADEGPVALRLAQALETPKEPGTVSVVEGDLDGDGFPETVTAPKSSFPGSGPGAIFVIYREDGKYEVDRTPDAPPDALPLTGVKLHGLRDIDGDGRPEIVWSTTMLVAHGPPSIVFVSAWEPGHITNLPSKVGMMSMSLELDGSDIVLSGGGAGGLSGMGQAYRTDRFRWVDGKVRLVDRQIARPESDGYTWLMQAISDEDLGKPEAAVASYRRALEPGRPIMGGFFSVDPAATEENFFAAVRALAQFRLGLLHLGQEPAAAKDGLPGVLAGAMTRDRACQAASAWMKDHPDYEHALNSLYGYAHPNWTADTVCGALHEATPFLPSP